MTSSFQFFTFPLCILLILHSSTTPTTLSQPTATAPPPPGPTNITKILEKAGQYTVLLRLFRMTQLGDQINTQLNNSDQGITLFAPTDNAFSALKPGLLNSLSDQQKVALVQFHVVPMFLSTSQFQTVSNPLRTQAGDTTPYTFPLNITTNGNQVNISTGVVNATVANSIYTDGSLAVYQVDTVLLPMRMFGPPAPAPVPVPAKKSKKTNAGDDSPAADDGRVSADVSSGVGLNQNLLGFIVGPAVIVMSCL
ncbi:putative FAS1 domain-containing protein [Helianthus annuus]|nr:putative FAS1 domain-containing protein [Helianthus annuus]KAJ0686807.1 putative FAS1 domain-containing protein [Helianthus annuus]KAJ0690614.1 putative FAS1 domain-containing protein [Helianthus annuus]KAJ0872215.1 putative FAS1 domain-containing protein [Helianthus annuus]